MNLHDLKLKILSQVPVNGPHADIEGELLLTGKKPLGWISLLPPTLGDGQDLHPRIRHELDIQNKLDEAVKEGRLKSIDVVSRVVRTDTRGRDFFPDMGSISRHYAQPSREKDLKVMASFNQAAFNRQKTDVKLEKDFGTYLGYRRHDQFFWNFRHRHRLPDKLMNIWADFAHNIAKPAYQELMLKRWHKLNDGKPEAPLNLPPPNKNDPLVETDLGWRCWQQTDYTRAMAWFRKAADQGDPIGQHNVGGMYEMGEGVKKNDAEAFFWHSLAARAKPRLYNEADANRVAQRLTPEQIEAVNERVEAWKPSAPSTAPDPLEDGLAAFKRQNGAEALSLLQPLAEKGDAEAQLHVGLIHLRGMGVPHDDKEALTWIQKAADQNLATAQVEMGHYCRGIGNDPAKAITWFRKAADQGLNYAQFLLSEAYAEGNGVKKDPEASLFWILRGYNFMLPENFMKKAAESLSPEQIAHVTKGAEAWRPVYTGPASAAPEATAAPAAPVPKFPVIWPGYRT